MNRIVQIILCVVIAAVSIIVMETLLLLYREYRRKTIYKLAQQRSNQLKKPLLVIGSPQAGFTHSIFGSTYGCGDVCLDLNGCHCNNSIKGDLLVELRKMKTNSYVIFESCVLEYIPSRRLAAINKELRRVAVDGEYYNVRIWPSIYANLFVSEEPNFLVSLVRDGLR